MPILAASEIAGGNVSINVDTIPTREFFEERVKHIQNQLQAKAKELKFHTAIDFNDLPKTITYTFSV